jgi:hypothetical protein
VSHQNPYPKFDLVIVPGQSRQFFWRASGQASDESELWRLALTFSFFFKGRAESSSRRKLQRQFGLHDST